MKRLRVRGAYLWLMTSIETTEDLMDAFNSSADMIISPYHFSLSDAILKDIMDVSDSFIPAVYVADGMGIRRGGRKSYVEDILDELMDMNYFRICVVDTDMSLTDRQWESIEDMCPSVIPFPGARYASVPASFVNKAFHVALRRYRRRNLRQPLSGLFPRGRRFLEIRDGQPTPFRPLSKALSSQ